MNYRPKEGIVLVRVCDTFLLAPTRAASEGCGHVARLSGMEAIMWNQMKKGKKTEDLCEIYAKFLFKTPEEVRPKVEERLARLYEKGFLTEAAEEAIE